MTAIIAGDGNLLKAFSVVCAGGVVSVSLPSELV